MNKEIRLPKISENEDTGLISEVYVKKGDHVDVEDAIIAVESDKATVDVPLEYAGEIVSVDVKEGEEISVGDTILTLDVDENDDSEEDEKKASKKETSSKSIEEKSRQEDQVKKESNEEDSTDGGDYAPAKKEKSESKEKDSKKADKDSEVPAAPLARKFARELGIDIKEVNPDDSSDRITREKVFEHARKIIHQKQNKQNAASDSGIELPDFSQWGNVERKPMSSIRRVTAEKTSQSWHNIPHVTQMDESDITNLENFREERKDDDLTLTAVLLKVIGFVLQEFPIFNASLDLENKEIILKDFIHVGVAVDTDNGLLIPVIQNVNEKSLLELSKELQGKAEKARNRDLAKDEMTGGNFVLSNLGGIGGTYFTPIIFPPQVAILGVSRAEVKPIFYENEFKPRTIMPLSLSYDHRIIDGADGARFLRRICEILEEPWNLFMGK
jgi:pyruvate dehydrogenase E2 component (dihydrolipoamide acetyltransferase)